MKIIDFGTFSQIFMDFYGFSGIRGGFFPKESQKISEILGDPRKYKEILENERKIVETTIDIQIGTGMHYFVSVFQSLNVSSGYFLILLLPSS